LAVRRIQARAVSLVLSERPSSSASSRSAISVSAFCLLSYQVRAIGSAPGGRAAAAGVAAAGAADVDRTPKAARTSGSAYNFRAGSAKAIRPRFRARATAAGVMPIRRANSDPLISSNLSLHVDPKGLIFNRFCATN